VAYVNLPNLSNVSFILGNRKGFLNICLFNSQTSFVNQMVSYFFGIMNDGAAHYELLIYDKTPILQSLLILSFNVFSYALGTK